MAATEQQVVGGPINDEALTGQIQPFLDEWFYRILASPVGKMWGRQKSLAILMDVFGMIGINIPPNDRDVVLASDDDATLVAAIITVIPAELRERLEATALQIQTVLHEATRILSASEDAGDDAVATLFDEAGSERGGLTQQVLKASVVYAAKEVAQLRKVHTTWRKNTDARIDRLLACAEEAEHCQQQLLAAEAQLSELKGDSKAKAKGALFSMAEGQDKALCHTIFSGWLGYVEKCHAEAGIRKRFTDQIENCETKLINFKEAKIANIKAVLMKGAMQETEVLLHMVIKTWLGEVKLSKDNGDTAEELKLVQARMDAFEGGQKEKAGKFMTRMASGNDESLKNICLEAWIKYHGDYAADKELEDKVKEAERKFKEHMDLKKDEAKAVLDRMSAGSDSGLQAMMFQYWVTFVKEEKKDKELELQLEAQTQKFKSLNQRQSGNAKGAQNRVNDQMNANIMQRVFNFWLIETKANRIENHYNSKYESKRRQLQGVQNLFKSFAMQLEQNLGGDDDSSSRTNRRSKHNKDKGLSKGAEGTVSLPDIHQKSTPIAT